MFPLLRNRAARALDVAIEFATLGEYGWEASPSQGAPARGANRRAVPAERREGAPARPAARLIAPASAAGRARPVPLGADVARARPVPLGAEAAVKELALGHEGVVPRPPVRARGGAAPPPPQPCDGPRR